MGSTYYLPLTTYYLLLTTYYLPGEISDALERQWGRFRPAHGVASGVYLSEFGSSEPEIEETVLPPKPYPLP